MPFNLIAARLFKKTVKLEDFIRSLVGIVMAVEPVGVLALKDHFSFEEMQRIRDELSAFRMVILYLFLFDSSFRDKIAVSEEEMGRFIGKATVLACQDKGIPVEKGGELMNAYFEYLKAILSNPESEVREKGLYFFACDQFSKKLLPSADLRNEEQRLRRFDLFDSAKQVYRTVEKSFNMARKTVKLEK